MLPQKPVDIYSDSVDKIINRLDSMDNKRFLEIYNTHEHHIGMTIEECYDELYGHNCYNKDLLDYE